MNGTVTTLVRGASWLARSVLSIFGAALAAETPDDKRQPHDTDLVGEYNHRAGPWTPETIPTASAKLFSGLALNRSPR